MNKKTVVILCDPLDRQSAGIYRINIEIIKSLLAEKDNFNIVLVREKADGKFPGLKTVLVPNFGFGILRRFFKYFFFYSRVCKSEKADIVIEPAHFGPFNLPKGTKRVTFIHDLTPLIMPKLHNSFSAFIQKLFFSKVVRKADLLVCNSQNTKEDLNDMFPRSIPKSKVVYPDVLPIFQPSNDQSVLDKLAIDTPFILSVGTIEPRKNYTTLIKAFNQLKDQDPNRKERLVISGRNGWKSEALIQQINQSKHKDDIIIINDITNHELAVLYSFCEVFIYPSLYEGYGLPVIEAYNCGAKCIVANNSSLAEISSSFATLFETTDSNDLCSKMISVLASQHETANVSKVFNDFGLKFSSSIKELL